MRLGRVLRHITMAILMKLLGITAPVTIEQKEWARKHLMRGDYMMFLAMCVSGLILLPLIMRIIANQVMRSPGSLDGWRQVHRGGGFDFDPDEVRSTGVMKRALMVNYMALGFRLMGR